MLKKHLKAFLTVSLIIILVAEIIYLKNIIKPNTVRAFGHLTVDLGVPSGEPIFFIQNMLPGDCATREVKVRNDSDSESHLAVRSENETDLDHLSQVLNIEISNSELFYSDTLMQFFTDAHSLDGVPLSILLPGEEITYNFNVCFDKSTGNEYRNTQIIFDLIFGEVISPFGLPEECSHLEGIVNFVVEGTEGDDDLRTENVSELILGLGGDDKLDGQRGDDCIVGGEGNDEIDGGRGNDIILGGPGDDVLDGESGDDTIYGQDGDDNVRGGSGDDKIYGGNGNDTMDGKSGEDYLDGGADIDDTDGGTGNDECTHSETTDSCET